MKTVAEHASHLRLVLARLEREKFYVKPSKCLFAVPCIDFCGFQVSAAGIATQPDKIALITNWPDPSSVKYVRSFLGVCGFYQRFIPSYAKISAHLTDLLKKSCVWHSDAVHRLAVSTLKAAFAQSAVLVFPDPAKEYLIHLDASEFAVEAMLSQDDSSGRSS